MNSGRNAAALLPGGCHAPFGRLDPYGGFDYGEPNVPLQRLPRCHPVEIEGEP